MSVADDLRAAKALIDKPEKWRKDAETFDPAACCAVIASTRLFGDEFDRDYDVVAALDRALPSNFTSPFPSVYARVGDFNDDRNTTHADIMALFDRAIEAAERESK